MGSTGVRLGDTPLPGSVADGNDLVAPERTAQLRRPANGDCEDAQGG